LIPFKKNPGQKGWGQRSKTIVTRRLVILNIRLYHHGYSKVTMQESNLIFPDSLNETINDRIQEILDICKSISAKAEYVTLH
jgi:hypothetical protein